jgi:hypothetical protein
MNGRVVGLTASPEFAVAVFAFLLNFPWEFLQTPLYVGMPALPHWEAIKICTRAALGDVAIMLLAFAVVALLIKDRHWIVRANVAHAACLSLAGLVVTTMIEWLAIMTCGWAAGGMRPACRRLHGLAWGWSRSCSGLSCRRSSCGLQSGTCGAQPRDT